MFTPEKRTQCDVREPVTYGDCRREEERGSLDPLDREYLTELIAKRENVDDPERSGILIDRLMRRAYYQGRIDEYCSQNAIDREDAPDLDLRLQRYTS
jgi:hypothetical protein